MPSKLSLLLGTRLTSGPPPTAKLAPSTQWNGTAGSGFGGANPAQPVDPVRNVGKPIVRPLFTPWMVVTDDKWICFEAGNNELLGGGLQGGITVWLEGNSINIPNETIRTYTGYEGEDRWAVGYWVQLDHAAWMAIASGTAKMVVVAVPTNMTQETRVLGGGTNDVNNPDLLFYAKASEFDVTQTIGVGGDFTTFAEARADAVARKTVNPLVSLNYEFITTADYPIETATTAYNETGPWTVFTAAPGVTATLGDGNSLFSDPKWSGMAFRGQGIVLDPTKFGARIGSSLLIPQATTQGHCRFAAKAVQHYCGTPNPSLGGGGSGSNSLTYGRRPTTYWIDSNSTAGAARNYFWEEVDAHDLVAYGWQTPRLVLNCNLTNCSGSGITSYWGAVHNVNMLEIGGYWTGQSIMENAFTWTYSGSSAVTYSVSGQTGASTRTFSVYYDDVLQGTPLSITLGVGTYTTFADVCAYLSALPDSSAVLTTPTTDRAAAFITIPGNGPAAAIALRSLSGSQVFGGIIDVHANAAAWDGNTFENVAMRFLDLPDGISAGWLSATNSAIRKDFLIRNCSYYDKSAEQVPPVTAEPGYNSGEDSNVFRQYETVVNATTYFGSSYHGDSFCQFDKSSWVNITYSLPFNGSMTSGSSLLTVTTKPNDVDITVGDRILHGNLPLDTVVVSQDSGTTGGAGTYTLSHPASGNIAGSAISMTWGDPHPSCENISFQNPSNSAYNRTIYGVASGSNSKTQSNAANSTLYMDAGNGDFTPKAPLQLGDGSWAGRYLPDGSENGVNYS